MSVKGNEESKSSNKPNLHFRSDHQRPRTPAAAERERWEVKREKAKVMRGLLLRALPQP